MEERRQNIRQRTFLRGRVIYDHGRGSAECVIRDMSDRGARLQFAGAVPLSDQVELQIPTRGETFRATVRWRAGDEAGLSFRLAGERSAVEGGGDLAERVALLEQELAQMKKQLRRFIQAQDPAVND